jgi:hypothetical protein
MATRKYPKLPKTYPNSLKYKDPAPSPLVKAKTHHGKAEELRKEGGKKGNVIFLERWKALEAAMEKMSDKAKKEYLNYHARTDLESWEILGHLIATLPRPRLDRIFKDQRIAELNLRLAKKNLNRLIGDNNYLQDHGINFKAFMTAKRDLKFHLGSQTYKSGMALSLYLTVVRASCDPKVRKSDNLISDAELLEIANGILRDVTTHIVEELQLEVDRFYAVDGRRERVAAQDKKVRERQLKMRMPMKKV